MKKAVFATMAAFGISILLAGFSPAFAGGNVPQDLWTWQQQEALETGAFPGEKAQEPKMESSSPERGADSSMTDFDTDPRYKESGGE